MSNCGSDGDEHGAEVLADQQRAHRPPPQADGAQRRDLVRPLAPPDVGRDEQRADRHDDGRRPADQEQPQRQDRAVTGVRPLQRGAALARLDGDARRAQLLAQRPLG
jgi:hypothetical protein